MEIRWREWMRRQQIVALVCRHTHAHNHTHTEDINVCMNACMQRHLQMLTLKNKSQFKSSFSAKGFRCHSLIFTDLFFSFFWSDSLRVKNNGSCKKRYLSPHSALKVYQIFHLANICQYFEHAFFSSFHVLAIDTIQSVQQEEKFPKESN